MARVEHYDGPIRIVITNDAEVEASPGLYVDGVRQRDLTAAEQSMLAVVDAGAAQARNRTAIDAGITAALTKLDQLIAAPPLADVPAGTLTTAQLSSVVRALRGGAQANRGGAQDVARILKQTIRLVRGDFDGVD